MWLSFENATTVVSRLRYQVSARCCRCGAETPRNSADMRGSFSLSKICLATSIVILSSGPLAGQESSAPAWNQWRGPARDGIVPGSHWPNSLDESVLKPLWRVELAHSYSGPIVSESAVYSTGTVDQTNEVVYAFDRQSGREVWRTTWPGAMSVPFFAASNGSWIRATPALDGQSLFVAGMRDVLVSLNATTGDEQWRVDFVEKFGTPLPSFGFVSSPLVDGDSVYVQAAASLVKLDKRTGAISWRVLKESGGMMDSAFSSPVIATLAGRRQLIVQTRSKLVGVDLQSGDTLWEQDVPSFRGMNILTPVVFDSGVFTSSYQNKSWLFKVVTADDGFRANESWSINAQGYMSTPVVVDGHAYMHLQNQRFACIDLATGERTWTSKPFGKYASLVAQGNLILALDQSGELLLIKANPAAFELVDRRKVSEQETWAHLAVRGNEVYVRELTALSAFRWQAVEAK
jgi:outer membrane protein assembly factor BamB